MSGPSLPVYLDHNATTAPAREVIAEMLDVLQRVWANPSSTHGPGQAARRVLADARTRIASFLGCQGSELVFTSGATEANHMAVLGALAAGRGAARTRWVLSAVEHPALLALAARLSADGVPVDLIPVDSQGRLDLAMARSLIRDDVALVSVMGANHQTGVLMPVHEIAELVHARGAWLHVDATQLLGKAPLRFVGSGADLMSVSAHKIAGPKGIGALLVRKGVELPPLLCGRQERQRRGGTENLPGIAGFAAACQRSAATLAGDIGHMANLRHRLEVGLRDACPQMHVFGGEAERLPNTSCLRFGLFDADQVLGRLERAGVIASAGAACAAGSNQPSPVLLAMGQGEPQARAALRFSLGCETGADEIDFTVAAVRRVIAPLFESATLAA